jgi:hypothetical protein
VREAEIGADDRPAVSYLEKSQAISIALTGNPDHESSGRPPSFPL